MNKTRFLCFFLIVVCQFISCQNISKSKARGNEIKIIKAYKTPITGGAPESKGIKIGLQLLKGDGVILDSLKYNGKVKKIDLVKSQNDTVWVESYFHSKEKKVRGKEISENRVNENFCNLYYHIGKESKVHLIPQLELKTDNTLWK